MSDILHSEYTSKPPTEIYPGVREVMSLRDSPNSRKHQTLTCSNSKDVLGVSIWCLLLFSTALAESVRKMLESFRERNRLIREKQFVFLRV